MFLCQRTWRLGHKIQNEKKSMRTLQYGPLTQLVRGIYYWRVKLALSFIYLFLYGCDTLLHLEKVHDAFLQ